MDPNTRTSAPLRVSAAIDRVTGAVGRAAAWLALAMVIVGAFNAIARYLGRYIGINLSSNVYLELQWYLFSILFLLGAAWVLREDAHVRVDVLYARVSTRTQSMINIAGTLLFLMPFSAFVLWVSVPVVSASWRIREGSPDPDGLPRYPLKALILVCFALLLVQAVSELMKELHRYRHADEIDARDLAARDAAGRSAGAGDAESRADDDRRGGGSHIPEGV